MIRNKCHEVLVHERARKENIVEDSKRRKKEKNIKKKFQTNQTQR